MSVEMKNKEDGQKIGIVLQLLREIAQCPVSWTAENKYHIMQIPVALLDDIKEVIKHYDFSN